MALRGAITDRPVLPAMTHHSDAGSQGILDHYEKW
jgi:hypothetical protein